MAIQQADVVVIGMGPGGEEVAGALAEEGLDVVGVEAELVGGECPYWGCVPSKMMVRAANLLAEARRIPGMSGRSAVQPDWAPVARRIRDEATDDWDDKVAVDRFTGKGGRFVRGRARFTDRRTVDVDGRAIRSSRGIVIATGLSAVIPPIEGLRESGYWTNRDAVKPETLPDSLAVLGGGAVGLEIGQAYARFGVKVSVVEAMDRLLPQDEPEAGDLLAGVLGGEGVFVTTGAKVVSVEPGIILNLDSGKKLSAERLLVATGRRADLAALNAGAAGLNEYSQFVSVDEHMRAGDGIWAVGDVTGHGAFTHVAMYQAQIATADILRRAHFSADYRAVPRVTFTDPEVGAVGMTEAEARDAGLDVATGSAPVASTARGWIHKAGNEGFIKLVADRGEGVLVGATSAGPVGGEVLGLLALAVHARVPLESLRSMIYAYPTFHRGVEDALRDLDE